MFNRLTIPQLVAGGSVFFVICDNFAFFRNVVHTYPVSLDYLAQLSSIPVLLFIVIMLILNIVCSRYTIKPILIILLLISSLAAYFMDTYNIFIGTHMLQNILETNADESLELLSPKLLFYFFFLGALPAYFVSKVELIRQPIKKAIMLKIKIVGISLLCMAVILFAFSRFYTSFFREHTPIRYYTNPTYYIYSAGKYIHESLTEQITTITPLGRDAVNANYNPITNTALITNIPLAKPELIILVVGEAARADHFSLNGYHRETNPLLKQTDVFSFSNVSSCGTTTAISVPCMFSNLGRDGYTDKKAKSSENLLDVLSYAGVNVLWRDNNSDSKGVALRVDYEEFKEPETNPECDEIECRDVGMLNGLQRYIDARKKEDILIVLHQMGNHGPAYYKRYPKSFEKFIPVCRTNELGDCTQDEIVNAYDNAILYTDYFLSKVIELLKHNSEQFQTGMVYFGDHGESLGENGIYLHGVPYAIAPKAQTHIPAIFWFGENFKVDREKLKQQIDNNYSQDNLFHTILGIMGIKTAVYNRELDILNEY
ncbi:MAG: phosphoethanolamine--lipid A transferase [Desulfamplus sp.]|nr:phosphoethanolamine--lipid A transferase [Desulfamplus sp.]